MARGQSLLTGFKARKSTGKWTDDDHSQLVGDLERWSQTIPVAGVGFRVRRDTSDAVIANGADTDVTWTIKDYDHEGFLSSGVNSIIVPPGYGGWYALNYWGYITTAAVGAVFAEIVAVRGGVATALTQMQLWTATTQHLPLSTLAPLYPGDRLKVTISNRAGGNITPLAVAAASAITPAGPHFQAMRIALLPKKINS